MTTEHGSHLLQKAAFSMRCAPCRNEHPECHHPFLKQQVGCDRQDHAKVKQNLCLKSEFYNYLERLSLVGQRQNLFFDFAFVLDLRCRCSVRRHVYKQKITQSTESNESVCSDFEFLAIVSKH